MSILIKGRNMPNNCQECVCLNDEYFYCQAVGRKPSDDNLVKTRPDWCPLIEIQPHGGLIDVDALLGRQKKAGKIKPYLESGLNVAISFVLTAPTIIPADGKDINVPTREEGEE